MGWNYALQCELPNHYDKTKLKWEDIAFSNDAGVLISQLLPNNRVINIRTKEVLVKHEVQRI